MTTINNKVVSVPVVAQMYGYTNQNNYKVEFVADAIVGSTVVLVQAPVSCDDMRCIIINHLPTDYPGTVRISVCNKQPKANYPELYLGRFIQMLDGIVIKCTDDRTSLMERVIVVESVVNEKGT